MSKRSMSQLMLLAIVTLAGCKKNDGPDTNPANPLYLPVVIYNTANDGSNNLRSAVDSIVYNADNTPATLFMQQIQNQEWRQRIQFGYNERQQCISIRWFSSNELKELDSLTYTGNKITVYKQDPINHRLRDSLFITFNNDNQASLFGSKDTVFEENIKRVRYTELTYSDRNPVKILDHRFDSFFEDATSTTDELTCTYDNHPNPLYEVFSRNPYIMNIIHQDDNTLSLGKNNLTSLVIRNNGGSNSTINFDHHYDADGNLSSSQASAVSGEKFGIEYRYIKR
ncbi:hypothetical protein [Chitinophaga pinensis]|uniref:Uncharacterized protein n=1 Tax=Chitinophaga pinensis (strain ATCC 43595 / DSM 2588 / LMG 13176 / NBRC 15968 / NCIMB 11800 / UQM 2034) TaxID=485918 RepID=A0A979G586_CHIPD|nr:hypothetical protein [Chitinophaga pinensis]ACU60953.1 hypothetical protein Cpin_3486 [Chitinophaga pinensis DSM 2588]